MIVHLENISKNFNDIKILQNISLTIKSNEIICILGPSGCGKSTLLNIISGLIKPDIGKINKKFDKMGYVFQEDRLMPWKTVYENINFVESKYSTDEIYQLIDDIGLKDFEHYYPEQLSGGMRQRCSIARAFNYHSELLLMDEPFKSLDYTLVIKMVKQLIKIWKNNKNSILLITHNIDEALLLGNRIVVLSNKPTKILKNFDINIDQQKRNLNDEILVNTRNEIIDLLFQTNDKGAYIE